MKTRREPGYSNQSAAAPRVWTPVVNPRPVFAGVEEAHRYREAVLSEARQPGEDVCDWLERVNARATTRPEGWLPYREVGEEG